MFSFRFGRVVMLALSFLLVGPIAAAFAQLRPDRSSTFRFDLAAQPLADALFGYSATTGIEILVPGDLVANRRAAAVQGEFPAEQALRLLLTGTGLAPRYTGSDAFTLLPQARPAGVLPAPADPRVVRYSAALQAALTGMVCRLPAAAVPARRVVARLWVDASGAVTRAGLVGTSGTPDQDAALVRWLGNVAIGVAPPAGLPQPATVLILPRQQRSGECSAHAGVRP